MGTNVNRELILVRLSPSPLSQPLSPPLAGGDKGEGETSSTPTLTLPHQGGGVFSAIGQGGEGGSVAMGSSAY